MKKNTNRAKSAHAKKNNSENNTKATVGNTPSTAKCGKHVRTTLAEPVLKDKADVFTVAGIYQFDCQVADIMLISNKNWNTPGRPMLFCVKDLSRGTTNRQAMAFPGDIASPVPTETYSGIVACPDLTSILERQFSKACGFIKFIDGCIAKLSPNGRNYKATQNHAHAAKNANKRKIVSPHRNKFAKTNNN
jgi:hypothetical protein